MSSTRLWLRATCACLCTFVPIYLFVDYRSSSAARGEREALTTYASMAKTSGLVLEPSVVKLGRLAPGQFAVSRMSITNHSSMPVRVAKIDTSCPCVTASPRALEVPAGGDCAIELRFDTAGEPEFRGHLVIDVVGQDESGKDVVRGLIDLEVSDRN